MDATRTTTLIDANQANAAAAADAVVKAIVISDEQEEEEEKRCPVLQALSVAN